MTQEIFIKVYPERLRALVKDHHLTRAQAGELVLLAMYINDQNICWPGKTDSVEKIGMKSPHWARTLHTKLKQKGVLDWDFDHDKRSPRFHLPDAFCFGSDYYRDRNSDPRGDRDSESRRGSISDHSESYDSDPEQESSGIRTIGRRTISNTQTGDFKKGGIELPTVTTSAHRANIRNLLNIGMNDWEAYLMAVQYPAQVIDQALDIVGKSTGVRNPAGLTKKVLADMAGPLNYQTNIPTSAAKTRAAIACTAVRNSNPYTDDAYFEQDTNSEPDIDNRNNATSGTNRQATYTSGTADRPF